MGIPEKIDICSLIDSNRVSRFQVLAITLCCLAVLLDGFDIQVIGFVAPAIVKAWKVDHASLAPVFAAGLAGLLVGSLVFSTAADRFGRRPLLILSTSLFAACMLATANVSNLRELMGLRFITGLALGSIIPNATALVSEYSPLCRRVTAVTFVALSFTIGAALAGFVAATVLPWWGWQTVFYIGGVLPLALSIVMLFTLPESLQFLVLRNDSAGVRRWMRRLSPETAMLDNPEFIVKETLKPGYPVTSLFNDRRGKMTLLLWGSSLLTLLNLYFLSNWLPTIVRDAGLSLSDAVLAGTALQVGGAVGAVSLGLCIDRAGFRRVLIPCFGAAAVSIFLIGQAGVALPFLFAVVGVTGFCIIGGQAAIGALSASYYPTALRATGIGWTLGVGRFGSILGPIVGGEFIGMGLPRSTLFLALAVPAAMTVAFVWAMDKTTADGAVSIRKIRAPMS
jgi:AAHS family 4-hydroxybenzoate transporter-like MFS transporter